MSSSLWPYELKHTRLSCPSLSPEVCSDSCPLSQWWLSNHLIHCHALLRLPSIFPSVRVFPTSQPFASVGKSIGASASTSVLPVNIQGWFPLVLTGWISLQSRGLSSIFSSTATWKLVNAGHIHLANICLQMRASPQFSSVRFSRSVVTNSLRPHGLQNTRRPCPSPTPGAYSDSRPSCRWRHPTISSSVFPFSSRLQSFPASGLFEWVSSLHQVAKMWPKHLLR